MDNVTEKPLSVVQEGLTKMTPRMWTEGQGFGLERPR